MRHDKFSLSSLFFMQDCVFFESALHLRRGPHMAVECVPVPEEAGEMAPMYFQKAIQVRFVIIELLPVILE